MAGKLKSTHPWFEVLRPCPTAKYQVFIFPAAGTANVAYGEWSKGFPDYEFALVIYPGRSTRMGDKLLTTINEYVNELQRGLVPYITKPCIFIGHSLGTAISFALVKSMVEKNNKGNLIKLLLAMGRGPPHVEDPDKSFHKMTDKEIVEDLKRMADPQTRAIFDYPDYVAMLLPILRADSKAGDDLLPATTTDVPIIVYGGDREENVKEPLLNRWNELTTRKDSFRVRMFHGHHNFQFECQDQVLACLKEDFKNFINKSSE